MKYVFLFIFLFVPTVTFAATMPSAVCPTGYTTLVKEQIILAEDTCPVGYSAVDTVENCQGSNADICALFVPANTEYNDRSGTYVFTMPCTDIE